MHKLNHRIYKIILGTVASLIVIFVCLCIWLYHSPLTTAKIKLFQALPLPLALVNNHPIAMKSFILKYNLAKSIYGPSALAQSDQEIKNQIYTQLVLNEEVAQLAAKLGVSVTQPEVEADYHIQASQADLRGNKNFEQLLSSYSISEATFKNEVLKPVLLSTNLQIWVNSQKALNLNAYDQAEQILQKIKAGESMVDLAAQTTQDAVGKAVGGDLGFVDPAQLLSELVEPVSNLKPGDVQIIPSRFGLHIIQLEEKNGNKLHLRQIFIKTDGYQVWFNEQTKSYQIKKLLAI